MVFNNCIMNKQITLLAALSIIWNITLNCNISGKEEGQQDRADFCSLHYVTNTAYIV